MCTLSLGGCLGPDCTRSEVSRRAVYLFTNTRTGDLKKLSLDANFFLV